MAAEAGGLPTEAELDELLSQLLEDEEEEEEEPPPITKRMAGNLAALLLRRECHRKEFRGLRYCVIQAMTAQLPILQGMLLRARLIWLVVKRAAFMMGFSMGYLRKRAIRMGQPAWVLNELATASGRHALCDSQMLDLLGSRPDLLEAQLEQGLLNMKIDEPYRTHEDIAYVKVSGSLVMMMSWASCYSGKDTGKFGEGAAVLVTPLIKKLQGWFGVNNSADLEIVSTNSGGESGQASDAIIKLRRTGNIVGYMEVKARNKEQVDFRQLTDNEMELATRAAEQPESPPFVLIVICNCMPFTPFNPTNPTYPAYQQDIFFTVVKNPVKLLKDGVLQRSDSNPNKIYFNSAAAERVPETDPQAVKAMQDHMRRAHQQKQTDKFIKANRRYHGR